MACALTITACGEKYDTSEDTDKSEQASSAIELSDKCVFLAGYTTIYDGIAKTPAVIIKYDREVYAELTSSNAEFEIAYANNVNVGTGTVTVSAKEGNTKFKGIVTLNITIRGAQKQIATYAYLKEALETENYNNITVATDITVAEGQTLIIPEGKSVYLDGGKIGDGTYTKSLIIDYVSGGPCYIKLENLRVNGMTLGTGVESNQVTLVNCTGV